MGAFIGKDLPVPEPHAGQRDVIAFLSDPASYGPGVDRVETHETHISRVFLAGDRAYKLKRVVKFPYLDFTTSARRRQVCLAELALNRRTAPDLYLKVRGIARRKNGTIDWIDDDRAALDWVVVMRRFDQALLFDSLAQKGRLTPRLMLDLIDHIAEFHALAEPRPIAAGQQRWPRSKRRTSWAC